VSGRLFWLILALIFGGVTLLVARDSFADVSFAGGDDAGRLFYLTILGLVVGASVFGSRRPVGDTFRMAALWALIVLTFITVYQYRYEFQDIASRVTAGLLPGSPLSVTDADGRTTVTLEKRSDGHFEAASEINDRPVRLMIDTGATTTVLRHQDAMKIGFDPTTLNFAVPISTANGQALAARVVLDTVGVGKIVRSNVPALVVADGMLEQSLLGMNFIGTLSGFDVRGSRIILRD
jgi:aspartyl protease family protein